MGLYFDCLRYLIHSVSKDKKYRVFNIQTQALVADYEPSDHELTYLVVNEERKKSFLSDRNGSIFIFDTDEVISVYQLIALRPSRNPLYI
jgi:hypothetical protein